MEIRTYNEEDKLDVNLYTTSLSSHTSHRRHADLNIEKKDFLISYFNNGS